MKEERGQRTVFVSNLPLDATERLVEEWFESRQCPVRDVQLVVDKQRRFKGLAYVELYTKAAVSDAVLTLNGQQCEGRPLSIEVSQSDRNQPSSPQHTSQDYPSAGATGAAGYPSRQAMEPLLRLYLGNLDYGITQDMLRQLLQQFGPVESVRLQTEPTGRSKGHAFIQFYHKEHALAAFHQLNTTSLAGRQLRCDFTKDARARDATLPQSPPLVSSRTTYFPESGSAVSAAASQPSTSSTQMTIPAHLQNQNVGSLEDETIGSGASMHNLIQRLAASSSSASGAITAANVTIHAQHNGNGAMLQQQQMAPQPLVPVIDKSSLPDPGTPSNCMCLKNLFDPSTETSPDFDKEIAEDVALEAQNFGSLNHIFVDKTSFVRICMHPFFLSSFAAFAHGPISNTF